MRWLSLAEVLALHRRLIEQTAGVGGLRDLGLLEAALAHGSRKARKEGLGCGALLVVNTRLKAQPGHLFDPGVIEQRKASFVIRAPFGAMAQQHGFEVPEEVIADGHPAGLLSHGGACRQRQQQPKGADRTHGGCAAHPVGSHQRRR